MNTITQLESLGYSFTLEGDKIRYTHTGELPDQAVARPLLAELSQRKAEAIQFLQERAPSLVKPEANGDSKSPDPPRFPLRIDWPDGVQACYYTPAMLRYAVHTRALIQEALSLGSVVKETESDD